LKQILQKDNTLWNGMDGSVKASSVTPSLHACT